MVSKQPAPKVNGTRDANVQKDSFHLQPLSRLALADCGQVLYTYIDAQKCGHGNSLRGSMILQFSGYLMQMQVWLSQSAGFFFSFGFISFILSFLHFNSSNNFSYALIGFIILVAWLSPAATEHLKQKKKWQFDAHWFILATCSGCSKLLMLALQCRDKAEAIYLVPEHIVGSMFTPHFMSFVWIQAIIDSEVAFFFPFSGTLYQLSLPSGFQLKGHTPFSLFRYSTDNFTYWLAQNQLVKKVVGVFLLTT